MDEPKQTLYVRGLPDKVSTNEMRRALYLYCTQFGPVQAVHYNKSINMYGQIFVVFSDVATATTARRAMHNRSFYGRIIQVFYAHRQSFSVAPAERRRRDTLRDMQQSKKYLE